MTVRDVVCIAIGELLLAVTFILGVLVGVALTRKDSRYDDGNKGTIRHAPGWTEWRDAQRR